MTHLDLFSGIGGFALAAEWAGFETIGFSEIDPYACKVLKKHWPNIPNYGDITKASFSTIGKVDLITGGFPCQPFSVAGKKLGDSDERHLWPELVRIVSEIRPRYTLFENVPGLLSISGGRVFNGILGDLCKIGYDCLWNLVPASAVGANHQRDRLWIVAHSGHDARGSQQKCERQASPKEPIGMCSANVAHTGRLSKRNEKSGINNNLENSSTQELWAKERDRLTNSSWWSIEPDVGRVVNGVPNRTHRLKGLGNSIVPQVAYIFLNELAKL